MFGKDKDKEEKKKPGEITGFIGKGVAMEGKLSFEDTMRIDGSFRGDISAPSGTLVVGDGGYIEGEIRVSSAVITGVIKGKLDASVRVELKSPAKMTGEIKTPTIIIEEGVIFEGACTMIKKDGAPETVEYEATAHSGPFPSFLKRGNES